MLLREETTHHKRYATSKPARNEELLMYYFRLMKEEGDKAFALSKSYLYNKCGELFHISGVEAGRIIRWMIMEKKYENFLTKEECEEYLDMLIKIKEQMGRYGRKEG